jgi:hypothetical protein
MTPTLHIIASCTDRKRAAVPDDLRLRSVPIKAIKDRANSWWLRLSRHKEQPIPAANLYAGGHWAVVQTLPESARRAGFNASLWVISAGYGLVSSIAPLHPYSATFAGAHPDTVASSAHNGQTLKSLRQAWWDALSEFPGPDGSDPRSLTSLVRKSRNAYFLIVASPDYLSAVERDLLGVSERMADPSKLIIISSRPDVADERLSDNLIPSDARLQARLGGARGSLNARVASLILNKAAVWGLNARALNRKLSNMISRSPELPKFERERLSDAQVRDFIRRDLRKVPQPSCSSLLRALRDGGLACEQSRFKNLYWEVKEGTP